MAHLLQLEALSKRYGETVALDGVSIGFEAGAIHTVLGENGSGKSTIVKLLSGVVRLDSGSIRLDGAPFAWRKPGEFRNRGISTVFQEVLIAPDRDAVDNILLGVDGLFRYTIARRDRRERAAAILAEIGAAAMPLEVPVGRLALAQQQLIVIARALARPVRVLILDESTAALDHGDRDAVFVAVKRRAAAGCAVIFISHRMDEVMRLSDKISVLRGGRLVRTLPRAEATPALLLELTAPARRVRRDIGMRDLDIRDLVLVDRAKAINDSIGAGCIAGLAGLDGHGQDAFLETLAGRRRPVRGSVAFGSAVVTSVRAATAAGIVYLPRDRRRTGIFPNLSVFDNFAIASVDADRDGALLSFRRRSRRYEAFREQLSILAAEPQRSIAHLSGGNQQKVLLARLLAREPAVLLLNDPTRGVDIATRQVLYDVFRRLAAEGMIIVLLSSEIEEVVGLCDPILVFREGQLSARLTGEARDTANVIAAMFGERA